MRLNTPLPPRPPGRCPQLHISAHEHLRLQPNSLAKGRGALHAKTIPFNSKRTWPALPRLDRKTQEPTAAARATKHGLGKALDQTLKLRKGSGAAQGLAKASTHDTVHPGLSATRHPCPLTRVGGWDGDGRVIEVPQQAGAVDDASQPQLEARAE